ncbi:siderophore-interacting protein [Paralcaligenes sp. KSB-10]|uniref:siderophore-interacting protein n=1 Tax=Paralcaligenes sp. KSB-10 TaxID=2901142 RepID=UPI001E2E42E6|nr:siderophore-interacting protein [Paralcaligenes sp. KSB-10]UHL64056.1 siderophore-interacting protein [Paralcaligenes sp. KSB-10]
MNDMTIQQPDLSVVRVRHALKARLLRATRVQSVTPHLLRVTVAGADLEGFESASFDDHVKVFFPVPGEDKPLMPVFGPNGPIFSAQEPRPVSRDFTPRRYDADAGELDIEFALHGTGPATHWAAQARVGQYLGIGGPRGSMIIPTSFDWHMLIGDETALPAIARRVEELPAGTRVIALMEVGQPDARIPFDTKADLSAEWRFRSEAEFPGAGLLAALREIAMPEGEGYVWAAGESSLIRAARQVLCDERGIDKKRIRAASYWKRGVDAVHETIDD